MTAIGRTATKIITTRMITRGTITNSGAGWRVFLSACSNRQRGRNLSNVRVHEMRTNLHNPKPAWGLTSAANSGKNYQMRRWQMSEWRINPASVFLLSGLIVLMLLIVILPDDVDLPDAAFHRGTAPVVVHDQATSAPLAITIAAAVPLPSPIETFYFFHRPTDSELYLSPSFRPILLRSIRC
jgi:hypothetical protein